MNNLTKKEVENRELIKEMLLHFANHKYKSENDLPKDILQRESGKYTNIGDLFRSFNRLIAALEFMIKYADCESNASFFETLKQMRKEVVQEWRDNEIEKLNKVK